MFKAVIIPNGIEYTKKGSNVCDYTGYWSGYDVRERSLYVQPEDCPTMIKFTLDPSISEKTTKAISHEFKTL